MLWTFSASHCFHFEFDPLLAIWQILCVKQIICTYYVFFFLWSTGVSVIVRLEESLKKGESQCRDIKPLKHAEWGPSPSSPSPFWNCVLHLWSVDWTWPGLHFRQWMLWPGLSAGTGHPSPSMSLCVLCKPFLKVSHSAFIIWKTFYWQYKGYSYSSYSTLYKYLVQLGCKKE